MERFVYLAHADAEAGRARSMDDEFSFKAFLLLIEIDIGQLRKPLQRALYDWCPAVELLNVVGLQRILVLGICLASAATHPDVLDRLQIKPRSWDQAELGAKPPHDLLDRHLALVAGLERNQ